MLRHAVFGILHGLSDYVEMTERLTYGVSPDDLTKLHGGREFQRQLECLVRDVRDGREIHSVLHLDLDEFKFINDTAGHNAGDLALLEIVDRFKSELRRGDLLARLDRDEFGLILLHCDAAMAEAIAWKLVSAVRGRMFRHGGQCFPLGLSVGIVQVDGNTASAADILRHASIACRAAKSAGKNSVRIFAYDTGEISSDPGDTLSVQDIARAISEDGFVLHRHGIYNVCAVNGEEGTLAAEEILVRMCVGGHAVAPGRFLPAAERFNMVSGIDMWVVNKLFSYLQCRSALDRHACFNVNLSGQSLGDESFTNHLVGALERLEDRCPNLCFEITETAAIHDMEEGIQFMNDLRGCGCRFALDDFGSGLSSLAYLKSIPADFLKIDGSLIKGIESDPKGRAMVKSIADMAHSLGMRVIAEYVESAECVETLMEIDVDYAQGYYYEQPQPLPLLRDGNEL